MVPRLCQLWTVDNTEVTGLPMSMEQSRDNMPTVVLALCFNRPVSSVAGVGSFLHVFDLLACCFISSSQAVAMSVDKQVLTAEIAYQFEDHLTRALGITPSQHSVHRSVNRW